MTIVILKLGTISKFDRAGFLRTWLIVLPVSLSLSPRLLGVCVCQHEAIMSFPSQQFYAGRLSVGSEQLQSQRSVLDFWPSSADEPIAFVHIDSIEQQMLMTPVDADDDDDECLMEKSVTNVDQVLHVVSLLIILLFFFAGKWRSTLS